MAKTNYIYDTHIIDLDSPSHVQNAYTGDKSHLKTLFDNVLNEMGNEGFILHKTIELSSKKKLVMIFYKNETTY